MQTKNGDTLLIVNCRSLTSARESREYTQNRQSAPLATDYGRFHDTADAGKPLTRMTTFMEVQIFESTDC